MLRRSFLLRFFELLYTRLAWAYDLIALTVSAGYWYRWGRAALPFIEQGPVLEVGCGRGRLLRPIANLGYLTLGLDRSLTMARHAARSGEPVMCATGQQLPVPDGALGTLITTFPAPYILAPETQREFARAVRPGGLWLWVDSPSLDSSTATLLARLVTLLAQGRTPEQDARSLLEEDRSGGLWQVHHRRVTMGATTIAVRLARRSREEIDEQQ
ncbi:MAG: class I SAM-dependent methyltransferase [Ardenticatenales bacterium]|nr:class I SAM-dependent methyltransferase [Ardenticatenales bacterium]